MNTIPKEQHNILNELANSFEDFANKNSFGKSPNEATTAMWLFCDEDQLGKKLLEDRQLEKEFRKEIQQRGWKIDTASSLLGEEKENFGDKVGDSLNGWG